MRCLPHFASGCAKKNNKCREGIPPGFSLRCQQSGSAHIGQKLIESCDKIVRCDNVCNRSSRGEDAVCAGRTGWTSSTCCARRAGSTRCTCCAYGALRASGSLNTGSASQAFRACRAGGTRRAGCTDRTLSALRSLRTLRTSWALRAARADRALRTGCTLLTGRVDDTGISATREGFTAVIPVRTAVIAIAATISDIIRQEIHLLSFCLIKVGELECCSLAYSMPVGEGA